ncbi:hypothetical protein LG161_002383 [Staphylococcus pseudintermedius]|nr:hypothetical protein [Staphylococcus pseudintermedius]
MANLYRDVLINQYNEMAILVKITKSLGIEVSEMKLNKNIYNNECILDDYSNIIRETWMAKKFTNSKSLYRSLIQNSHMEEVKFNNYEYERMVKSNGLEKYYKYNFQNIKSFTNLYSSGMAAISNTVISLKSAFSGKINGLIDIGYFETNNLFYLLKNMGVNSYFWSEDLSKIKCDFYFFEPIKYSFFKNESNYIDNIKSISKDESYLFVIIDISLCGDSFDLEGFINKIYDLKKIVVIIVESLLKLSQQGFEMTNGGRASWFFNKNDQDLYEFFEKTTQNYIQVTGAGLSDFNSSLLDNSLFLNNYNYSERILENNVCFYNEIKELHNEIIEEIIFGEDKVNSVHYGLPFIFVKLTTPSEKFNNSFLNYLKKDMEKFSLNLDVRDSFGFRNISAQYFKDANSGLCVFKIAIGHLKGAKYYLLLDSFKKTNNLKKNDFVKKYVEWVK